MLNCLSFLILALTIAISGCSGKIQTNPEPNPKKFNLPRAEINLAKTVNGFYVEDYENYVRNFFITKKPDFQRDIWKFGVQKRGIYD